jgi:hypothetical protein
VLVGSRPSLVKLLSLIPVVAGVGLACVLSLHLGDPLLNAFHSTYGDYYYTCWGFVLTLLGAFLAAFKSVVTQILLSPLPSPSPSPSTDIELSLSTSKQQQQQQQQQQQRYIPVLHPLDLLHWTSSHALIQCVLYAYLTGELDRAHTYFELELTPHKVLSLVANGAIAFGVNVISFHTNRKLGAVGMSVAGASPSSSLPNPSKIFSVANVKQVLTIVLAIQLFNLTVPNMNAVGLALTLVGGAVYAFVEHREREERKAVEHAVVLPYSK